MGVEKALTAAGRAAACRHVAARFAPQVDALILNANGDAARFAFLRCAIVADATPNAGGGPLAGVAAALRHAHMQGFEWLAATPCDAPFLPLDLVARLARRRRKGRADRRRRRRGRPRTNVLRCGRPHSRPRSRRRWRRATAPAPTDDAIWRSASFVRRRRSLRQSQHAGRIRRCGGAAELTRHTVADGSGAAALSAISSSSQSRKARIFGRLRRVSG